jgi:hypothetical protein
MAELTWDEFKFEVQKHSKLPESKAESFFDKFERRNFSPKKIVPLVEAKVELEDPYFNNFVYDRTTGVVLVNMHSHCYSLDQLHHALSGEEHTYGTDRYLEQQLGFYKSSISKTVYKNQYTRLNAQEQMVFRGLEFESA